MPLIDFVNFLKTPADRDVIRRWTAPPGPTRYAVTLPAPPDPERFSFLVLGDSGDSAGIRARVSPQDAVARELAADAVAPVGKGDGQFVIHTGDVVYMAGERRLYDRNFRRPYAAFLTPDSTVDHLVFRLPFLPVPGNHDYYDFAGWAAALARTPYIGAGVAAIARQLFAFQIPAGGSDMGAAYMHAFVDPEMDGRPYVPGADTRLPNRYYRFSLGSVDFFALDSNTLEAPPPSADLDRERTSAAARVRELEKRARALGREIQRDEKAVENWLAERRRQAAADPTANTAEREATREVGLALDGLAQTLESVDCAGAADVNIADTAETLRRRWWEAAEALARARPGEEEERALEALDAAGDDCCPLLETVENCFTNLPEGPERAALLSARERLLAAAVGWRDKVTGIPPEELCGRITQLSAQVLDVQRELARERRRMGRQPEDHDAAQLAWLAEALEESVRERPGAWRVVYLHQPLYTSIGNHSENSDVAGVRENLVPLLRDRVDLVLAGHAHAFEWFRSSLLPTTALITSGGGGQPWLWRSILDPSRFRHYRRLYGCLREAGATETAFAGYGPPATDGARGQLYHYVRVEVTPEALVVRPVGVRRLDGRYRREAPMPVYYAPEFPSGEPAARPLLEQRALEAVEVRRGEAPVLRWE